MNRFKIKKKILVEIILLLGSAVFVFYMGFIGIYNFGIVKKVESVTINTETVGVKVGSKHQLSSNVYPSNVASHKVIWKSSDEKIAKVNSNGIVTGIKSGSVTITATSLESKKITDTVEVIVSDDDVKLEYINCKQGVVYLESGYKYLLELEFSPSESNNLELTYSSSNKDVVSVDKLGFIKGLEIGKSSITIEDTKTGIIGTCYVTVLSTGGLQGNK